jgi:hypothetical protein
MSEFDANSIVQYAGCIRVESGGIDGVLSTRLASVALALYEHGESPFTLEDRKGDLVLIPHRRWADISASTVHTACRMWSALGEITVSLNSRQHNVFIDSTSSVQTIARAIAAMVEHDES